MTKKNTSHARSSERLLCKIEDNIPAQEKQIAAARMKQHKLEEEGQREGKETKRQTTQKTIKEKIILTAVV